VTAAAGGPWLGRASTIFAAFALACFIAVLVPVGLGDVDYNRARLTVWAALLLAGLALAMVILRAGRRPLGEDWRGWWSAAFLMFLLHLVWGLGAIFKADVGAVFVVQGTLVAGSNFLLTALWGASVAMAWLGTGPMGLHLAASQLLAVSGLVSTLVFGHGPSTGVGTVLLLLLVGAGVGRFTSGPMSSETKAMPPSHSPQKPILTTCDLVQQFWRDIYGKEVQSAATYSYTWMADQMGHVCIGIVLDFAFTVIAYRLLSAGADWYQAVGFLLSALVVSYWEYRAYSTDAAKGSDGPFPLDTRLLRDNAVIAAGYMIIGALVGWAFHLTLEWALSIVLAMVVLSIVLAPRWLRQKIIWQKAALPYLARLADFNPKANANVARIDPASAQALWEIIEAAAPPAASPHLVVVGGAIGSGRTTFGCGIGTEFSFKNACVRYLTFNALIELAAAGNFETGASSGPPNIGYWAWSRSQILIVDDLGPMITAAGLRASGQMRQGLENLLCAYLSPFAAALSLRNTIWITDADTPAELSDMAGAIGAFCRNPSPLAIALEPKVQR